MIGRRLAVTLASLALVLVPVGVPAAHAEPTPPSPTAPAPEGELPAGVGAEVLDPARIAALEEQARALQERLDAANERAEHLSEELSAAREELSTLQARAEILTVRLGLAEGALEGAQDTLVRRARAAYIAGGDPSELVSALWPDLTPSARYTVQKLLATDNRAVDSAEDARNEVARLRSELLTATSRQKILTLVLEDRQQQLDKVAAEIESELATASAELRAALEQLRLQEEAERRVEWEAYLAAAGGEQSDALGLRPAPEAQQAVDMALDQLGNPYLWGATGPDAFDCSGLVQFSYAYAGVTLPRVSRDQWGAGEQVPLTELVPGDLLFWASDVSDPTTIHHMGMYIGQGLIVHAPRTGDVIRIAPVWQDGLIGAVRPVPARQPKGEAPADDSRPDAVTDPEPASLGRR